MADTALLLVLVSLLVLVGLYFVWATRKQRQPDPQPQAPAPRKKKISKRKAKAIAAAIPVLDLPEEEKATTDVVPVLEEETQVTTEPVQNEEENVDEEEVVAEPAELTLVTIPVEVWLFFLCRLRVHEIKSVLCTCRALYRTLDNEDLFKALYISKFGRIASKKGKGSRKKAKQEINWKQTFTEKNVQQCETAKNWDNFPDWQRVQLVREYIHAMLHPRWGHATCLPKHIEWNINAEDDTWSSRRYHHLTVNFNCKNCTWTEEYLDRWNSGYAPNDIALQFCPFAQWEAIRNLRERSKKYARHQGYNTYGNQRYCNHVYFIWEGNRGKPDCYIRCSKCSETISGEEYWYAVDPSKYPTWDRAEFDEELYELEI